MSAPSGGATSAPQCACSNISIMQLFHELKQQYPGVPDHVVSSTISSNCHDRLACQTRLECEAKNFISHLYPTSSLSGSRKDENKDVFLPQQCRNQLAITKEVSKASHAHISSTSPQKAVVSVQYAADTLNNNDYNQNCLSDKGNKNISSDDKSARSEQLINPCSDNLHSQNNSNVTRTQDKRDSKQTKASNVNCGHSAVREVSNEVEVCDACQLDNKNYKILKCNKVRSNLDKKLVFQQNVKGSETERSTESGQVTGECEKVKRPNTLHFVTNPQCDRFDHKSNYQAPPPTARPAEPLQGNNPLLSGEANDPAVTASNADGDKQPPGHLGDAYPLNVSVNLNCRMDVGGRSRSNQFPETWKGGYSSPGNFTSVNLTVCTPTSVTHNVPVDNRNSFSGGHFVNIGDLRQRGFEGHVQITVSPASSHPVYQPLASSKQRYPAAPVTMSETIPATPLDALIRRQKARLEQLEQALMADRARLASVQREVHALQAPTPLSSLRPEVQRLRTVCNNLAQRLDQIQSNSDEVHSGRHNAERSGEHDMDYGASLWQCHLCTFHNHNLLNKCEECDMPRIILGTCMTDQTPTNSQNTLALDGPTDNRLVLDTTNNNMPLKDSVMDTQNASPEVPEHAS